MSAYRTAYRVVVANATQALATYDHMRALAQHAVPLNPSTPAEEPAFGRVDEVIDGQLVHRRGYMIDAGGLVDDVETDLGAGPFVISGMAPYPDESHADNALAHAEALAQQGAAVVTGQQMAAFAPGRSRPTHSMGHVHVCLHEEGLPCTMGDTFAVLLPEVATGIDWVAGETVVAGDVRWYDGVAYVCEIGHTTQADWTPPTTPTLWTAQ